MLNRNRRSGIKVTHTHTRVMRAWARRAEIQRIIREPLNLFYRRSSFDNILVYFITKIYFYPINKIEFVLPKPLCIFNRSVRAQWTEGGNMRNQMTYINFRTIGLVKVHISFQTTVIDG